MASKGSTVLRYDKRTKVYPQTFGKNFTVNDETVNDAAAAADLLMKTSGVNPEKVFMLGHSLGGYMIPCIAERAPKAAGSIVFAGGARPLEDIILEQNSELLSKDGKILPEHEKDFEAVKAKVAAVKNLKPSDANSDTSIFSIPASYRLDLQNYNPVKTASVQKKPMLSYRVNATFKLKPADFNMWKTKLSKRKNVELKSYPNLTHFFYEVTGGTPGLKDYETKGNLSQTVVNDCKLGFEKLKSDSEKEKVEKSIFRLFLSEIKIFLTFLFAYPSERYSFFPKSFYLRRPSP